MSKWKAIETAPEDGTLVLLYGEDKYQCAVGCRNRRLGIWEDTLDGDDIELHFYIRYWMPLPEPPDAAA